jgi:hypothetical protein
VLTVCHTQSTTLSSSESSPFPTVCKKTLALIPLDVDPPYLLRDTGPPGLGSIKKLNLIDSAGLY